MIGEKSLNGFWCEEVVKSEEYTFVAGKVPDCNQKFGSCRVSVKGYDNFARPTLRRFI